MRNKQSIVRTGDSAAGPMSSAHGGHRRSTYATTRPAEPPQQVTPVGNEARVRQRILAIFLPVTAVLYVSCEALDAKAPIKWSRP